MTRNIYAIRDNVAKTVTGGLHIFPADAAAVRFFGDLAAAEGNMISKHVADYDLLRLGTLDEDTCTIVPDLSGDSIVVITGTGWKAAQAPADYQPALAH